jgi:hypothetical protein
MKRSPSFFPPFDETEEDWDHFLIRLEKYFSAIDVRDNERKKNLFMSAIPTKVARLLRNSSRTPFTHKTYEVLQRRATLYYKPYESRWHYVRQFRATLRGQTEAAPDFAERLQKLAQKCDFGEAENVNILDQFVLGINEPQIETTLCIRIDLKLELAINLATSMLNAMDNIKKGSIMRHTRNTSNGSTCSASAVSETSESNRKYQISDSSDAASPKMDFSQHCCLQCQNVGHSPDICHGQWNKFPKCPCNSNIPLYCLAVRKWHKKAQESRLSQGHINHNHNNKPSRDAPPISHIKPTAAAVFRKFSSLSLTSKVPDAKLSSEFLIIMIENGVYF